MDFVLYAIEDYIVGRNFIEKFLVVKDRLLRYNRKKLSTEVRADESLKRAGL